MSRDIQPATDDEIAEARMFAENSLKAPSHLTRKVLARLGAIQSDRDELHGRLLESSKRLLEIKAERDALQAVVDKLDKTDDGKPAVTGDTVYRMTRSTGKIEPHEVVCEARAINRDIGINWSLRGCYSTRAAAEAAMKEQSDGD